MIEIYCFLTLRVLKLARDTMTVVLSYHLVQYCIFEWILLLYTYILKSIYSTFVFRKCYCQILTLI